MTMKQSHTSFPDDLIVEIILKLPVKYLNVKYLLQLRCVCKSWYRIIGTNSLINSAIISNTINNSYLLCTHRDIYTLQELKEEEEEKDILLSDNSSSERGKYYYMPKLFGINKRGCDSKIRVFGICKGLLCVSDSRLHIRSCVYLWNPVIRKAKRISMFPRGEFHEPGNADLCFGYFDDDYKVVKIAPSWGKYRVGVYSLRSDAWKVMYCDSNYVTFWWLWNQSSNKFVNGVAYFVKYTCRIVCFDLHHERIREVQFPDEFVPQTCPFSVEPWGESIALIEIRHGHLTKWVLRNCVATNTSTWEKKVTVRLETQFYMYPLGFAKHGKYLLRDDLGSCSMYLWDFGTSQLEEYKSESGTNHLWAIDSLVGNFVLLDEKTLDPFVEMEPSSARTTCILYKTLEARKNATEMLDSTHNRMQRRRWTDRRVIEHTGMEKPRKKGRKELSDKTQNRLQGRGTKRRMEETEMKKQRKN